MELVRGKRNHVENNSQVHENTSDDMKMKTDVLITKLYL